MGIGAIVETSTQLGSGPVMHLSDFRKAGHTPTLLSAFLYFDVSFMIWVLVGALAVSISGSLLAQARRRLRRRVSAPDRTA